MNMRSIEHGKNEIDGLIKKSKRAQKTAIVLLIVSFLLVGASLILAGYEVDKIVNQSK